MQNKGKKKGFYKYILTSRPSQDGNLRAGPIKARVSEDIVLFEA